MIEEILAVILLIYVILNGLKQLSEEKLDKLVYHSKVTRVVAQIISMVGSLTVVFGLMMFVSISVLSLIQSGLFEQTIINNEWDKPLLMFLTVIGAMAIVVMPLWLRLPIYGNKKSSHFGRK